MQKGFLSLLGILITFIILIFLIITVLGKITAKNQNSFTNNPRQIEQEAKKNIEDLQQKSRQNQSVDIE